MRLFVPFPAQPTSGCLGLEMIAMLGLYEWLHEEIENENKAYRNGDGTSRSARESREN